MTALHCPVHPQVWTDPGLPPVQAVIIWPVDVSCCTTTDLLLPVNRRFVAAAVEALWEKTCGKYGICTVTVRPCERICGCYSGCIGECAWRKFDLRDLVTAPIVSVDAVNIEGVVIPAADYWIADGRYLVPYRTGALWDIQPQDMNAPFPGPGTWGITITVGQIPPPLLLIAAAELACQIARYCSGQPCDLPPNAISVTRDGVTVRLETGFQAIPTVKMALEAYGCDKTTKKYRSRIVDPGEFLPSARL
jgi:hypothetical protein